MITGGYLWIGNQMRSKKVIKINCKGTEAKFDELAGKYDSLYTDSESKKIDYEVKKRLKKIENVNIIDIGCGTGCLLDLIDIKKEKYIGVDISSKMIKRARSKFKNYKFKCTHEIPIDSTGVYVFLYSLNYIGIEIFKKLNYGSNVLGVILTDERMNSKQYKEIYEDMGIKISLTKMEKYIKFTSIYKLSNYYIYFEGVRNGECERIYS